MLGSAPLFTFALTAIFLPRSLSATVPAPLPPCHDGFFKILPDPYCLRCPGGKGDGNANTCQCKIDRTDPSNPKCKCNPPNPRWVFDPDNENNGVGDCMCDPEQLYINDPNMLVGGPLRCVCGPGAMTVGSVGQCACRAMFIRGKDENGRTACICNDAKGVKPDPDNKANCLCKAHGATFNGSKCVCPAKFVMNEAGDACVCDASKGLIADPDNENSCICQASDSKWNGSKCSCPTKRAVNEDGDAWVCDPNLFLVPDPNNQNACTCKAHSSWDGSKCRCDQGYGPYYYRDAPGGDCLLCPQVGGPENCPPR